jgi:hypothetical protein
LLRSGTSAMPSRATRCGGQFSMRSPWNWTTPSLTRASSRPRKPEIARSVVVLPAPLLPMSATMPPAGTRNETPCTAVLTRW